MQKDLTCIYKRFNVTQKLIELSCYYLRQQCGWLDYGPPFFSPSGWRERCCESFVEKVNSFSVVPKGCSKGVLRTFGITAKSYGRKMLIMEHQLLINSRDLYSSFNYVV